MVRDVYEALNEDFEEVLSRLDKEERIGRYLNRFIAEDYLGETLLKLEEKDYPEAFRLVHSIKGMGMNIGMVKLYKAADVLCEAIRHGAPTVDITGMIEDLTTEYKKVVEAIQTYNI